MNRIVFLLVLALAETARGQVEFEPFFPEPDCPIIIELPCDFPPQSAVVEQPRSEKRAYSDDAVLHWNEVALRAIRAEKTPPPVAARNLALVHAAVYDSVAAIRPNYRPYLVAKKVVEDASLPAAVGVAAHDALAAIYPRQRDSFNAALDTTLSAIPEGAAREKGMQIGRSVAEQFLDWRKRDLVDARSSYKISPELGRWQPTFPDYKSALLPEWTSVRTFAVKHSDAFRVPPPPSLESLEFIASFREVKAIGARNSQTRSADQTEVAHFWEDGVGTVTPPGHWNRVAQTVATQRRLSTAENARLFAMLNVALADAAICCWDCKYHFDFWRPVTAIRNADRLRNPALQEDPNWEPLLLTPPFPSYTSGHSTFSAAAAAVLAHFFGSDQIPFAATSEQTPGRYRSFSSFSDAAREAGMSRIYGGIHWDFDNREGLEAGRKVGEYVSRNYFQVTRDELRPDQARVSSSYR